MDVTTIGRNLEGLKPFLSPCAVLLASFCGCCSCLSLAILMVKDKDSEAKGFGGIGGGGRRLQGVPFKRGHFRPRQSYKAQG